MIELQHIIDSKRELLSRETYSRNPINYSEGMADDQKDRYIQYLAEQNQDLRLTNDAMNTYSGAYPFIFRQLIKHKNSL